MTKHNSVAFFILLFACSVLPAHARASLTDGLVGYWTMDGKNTNWSTGATADLSGNGNNGSMVGMSTTTSPVAGKIGQAIITGLNTSTYINLGTPPSL